MKHQHYLNAEAQGALSCNDHSASYQSPNLNCDASTSEIQRSHPPLGSVFAMFLWVTGTFLFSLLIISDILIGSRLPGGVIYVALLLGPILGICVAVATNYDARAKIGLIIAMFCLLPIQFIVTGLVLLAFTGFDGIH